MKTKFIITETKPAVYYWTYEIEADTEAEAIELIQAGNIDPIDEGYSCEFSEDSDYTVE
jgi:hypothetical protein